MEHLLTLLRGHTLALAEEDGAWEQMLALAEQEHVLPWAARLGLQQRPKSQTLRNRLHAVEREAAIAAFYWSTELSKILHAFQLEELAVVPLKGPFLAERLYGGTPLRVSYDLDLLVSIDDLGRAEAALSTLGFHAGAPDDYHRQWYRGPTTVELHHDVENPLAFDFRVGEALQRAQPATFQGEPCRQLTAEDERLFLCLHAVRHRFERLSVILDLWLAFQTLHSSDGAARPASDADASLLALGRAMANRLRPLGETACSPPALPPTQAKHLEQLADRLWCSVTTQPSELLDWRTLHSFYLEIEMPGRSRLKRRMRHVQILLSRVIAADYAFAARFGCRRTWQVRLLRPLRLLRDAIGQRVGSAERTPAP